jgi:hypothetical protein
MDQITKRVCIACGMQEAWQRDFQDRELCHKCVNARCEIRNCLICKINRICYETTCFKNQVKTLDWFCKFCIVRCNICPKDEPCRHKNYSTQT